MQCDNTRIVGIAWYERKEYAAARGVMQDAYLLPIEYEAWLRTAELVVLLEEAKGSTVIRAPIRPAAFAAWCAATGQLPDLRARTRHVNLAIDDHCAALRAIGVFEEVEDPGVEERESA